MQHPPSPVISTQDLEDLLLNCGSCDDDSSGSETKIMSDSEIMKYLGKIIFKSIKL